MSIKNAQQRQIETDEDEADIISTIDFSERRSPWLVNLTTPIPAQRDLQIIRGD